MNFYTIPEMLLNVAASYPEKTAYQFKSGGSYAGITYADLKYKIECLALALLDLGIRKGDRLGIASENRIEWIIADLATVSIGAVDVPVFPILTSKQEEFIFSDSSVTAIFVSNNFQLGKVLEFKERLPSLRHIIVFNDEFDDSDLSVKSLNGLISSGEKILKNRSKKGIFEEMCAKVTEDDLLTIIYTSGTTGEPKGVMLTHKNVVTNMKGCIKVILFSHEDIVFSYLPLCHSYERTTAYYSLFAVGATIGLAESIESIASDLLEIKPTLMTTVPKLLETVKKRIYSKVEKDKPVKRAIFNWAINIGIKLVRKKQAGKDPLLLKAQWAIADRLVYTKIREKLGGRMRVIVSGGAALPEDVCEFYLAIGIDTIQGYGLTEASPVVAANRPEDNEIGTIGKPLPGVEVKLADDGEILARGDNVMKGYWNDENATITAIDEDGWLYTGDVGSWTERGNIRITDRKKYIFVSSGGKNIAPQLIENVLAQSKYIEHVILLGDKRDYVTALITPNMEAMVVLAAQLGIKHHNEDEIITNIAVKNMVKREIDVLQQNFSKFERVRKFHILSKPFTVEDGELSPKMSIKRHVVEKKYAEFIEAMYVRH